MKRIIPLLLCLVLALSGCIAGSQAPATPADTPIESPGDATFASFDAIDLQYQPRLEPYDFSAENIDSLFLTGQQLAMLLSDGFVISPYASDMLFHEYYAAVERQGMPIFITTDAMLHTFHIIYDYSLRELETNVFFGEIIGLSEAMLAASISQYESVPEALREAAEMNVSFYAVGLSLLDPENELLGSVPADVEEELALIDLADGISVSPIFGYREDYSQYVPRGHYTRSELLGSYFKALMWYGRLTFLLKEPVQTQAAILSCLALSSTEVGERSSLDIWESIYSTTAFYVGDADDLTIMDYACIIAEVFGETVTYDEIVDEALFSLFMEKAWDLPNPRINSSVITDQDSLEEDTKGYRFMGQRFILDSYIFSELVYDNVLGYYGEGEPFTLVYSDAGPIRGFPRGLDVFGILGFDLASDILEEEGDTDYFGYDEQVAKLTQEVSAYTMEEWTENLYTTWLYTLSALSHEAGDGMPSFMQSGAWDYKRLNTALGSWAELRHDTILYAKQSYTFEATSMPMGSEYPAYVEPEPEVYGRLLSLTRMTMEGLDSRGILQGEIAEKLSMLDSLLDTLVDVSVKQLEGSGLSDEEVHVLESFDSTLEALCTFSEDFASMESEADSSVAIVADVHTDVNSMQVLEEGVGYPLPIYVVVNRDGHTYVAQGAVFSYYEFKHPLSDRLTDEAWQELLEEGNGPDLPQWVSRIVRE
jgi:hypothetical protein